MNEIVVPAKYNYIGVFLTLRCNLNCSYCINHHGTTHNVPYELSTSGWLEGLSRIETRPDLPISLQGGEPTTHPGFYDIVDTLHNAGKHLDLLTNGTFDVREFCGRVSPSVFRTNARYAGIRLSFHEKTNAEALANKAWLLQNKGYRVGIWALEHPSLKHHEANDKMKDLCRWLNLDFRVKEFLGTYNDKLHGTYRYPKAVQQKGSKRKLVYCNPSEFLINPAGYIFRCHSDLYASRDFIGHVLDHEIEFKGFQSCAYYGHCNPCDLKVKFDRFQKAGHCSVEIKGKGIK